MTTGEIIVNVNVNIGSIFLRMEDAVGIRCPIKRATPSVGARAALGPAPGRSSPNRGISLVAAPSCVRLTRQPSSVPGVIRPAPTFPGATTSVRPGGRVRHILV